jgi:hypothetical protein
MVFSEALEIGAMAFNVKTPPNVRYRTDLPSNRCAESIVAIEELAMCALAGTLTPVVRNT